MYNPYGKVERKAAVVAPAAVVSFDQEDHPALSRNLLQDLRAERDQCYMGLIASKDWSDFERRRGLITGLDVAIAFCQKSQEKLS